MRAGEFPDGARVLRARIDMAAPNINLRDPVLYRILHAEHPRTGDAWCIYPTYDFAHGQSDAIEGITHSICTLEFEAHRPLYDWLIENLPVPSRPHQYEFARLNLTHTVMSKRVLLRLVNEGIVRGWDDPRMPTLSGLRRRGFPGRGHPRLRGDGRRGQDRQRGRGGDARARRAQRAQPHGAAPLRRARPAQGRHRRTTPRARVEEMEVPNNPEDPSAGHAPACPSRRELWIERDDFMEEPVRKFFRLAPGREVRLRSAYFVTCREVVKDAAGRIVELRCTYDPATRGGDAPDGRRPKATLHWVSAAHAVPAEVRLYDHLFCKPDPGADGDLFADLNPDSETVLRGLLRRAVAGRRAGRRDRAVRAPRLLLPRPRLGARRARVQPHAHAQGHLGQAAGAGPAETTRLAASAGRRARRGVSGHASPRLRTLVALRGAAKLKQPCGHRWRVA